MLSWRNKKSISTFRLTYLFFFYLTRTICLPHRGIQLRLAYSWARPAILVAGKGRGGMFLFLLFLHLHSCSSFFPVPLFHLLFCLFSKWPTGGDVSLSPNSINQSMKTILSIFYTFTDHKSRMTQIDSFEFHFLITCYKIKREKNMFLKNRIFWLVYYKAFFQSTVTRGKSDWWFIISGNTNLHKAY